MTEKTEKQYRNSEAKFASPETNEGIGYYFDGVEVSPDEFSEKVAQRAGEIRAGRAEARVDE